ncbi:hypothetical protein VM1G_04747 [Cytospora mali]|uniref:Uncharacterized protein n=1 Tax=Cytospora mali TaxID=578113 RepID=A0A194VZE7_CYTMA|nr:hypothetical protein VM1G_04747 [Valsa mali]
MPFFTVSNTIPKASISITANPDPFNLDRFIKAQDENDTFNRVVATIREGRRKPQPTNWMWFVFPQMNKCLTRDRRLNRREQDVWPRGQELTSLDEARAYLRHPILGPRIREAARAVLDSPFTDKFTVMDNMFYDTDRLHSSMTIFRQAARYPKCIHEREHHIRDNYVFRQVLDRYFVDLDSDDEDDLLDESNRELLKMCRGKRHKPTIKRLDALELEAVERRLVRGEGCVCGRPKEELELLDKGSKEKIMMDRQFWRTKKIRAKAVLVDHPGEVSKSSVRDHLPTPAPEIY